MLEVAAFEPSLTIAESKQRERETLVCLENILV